MKKIRAISMLLVLLISTTLISCGGSTPTATVEEFLNGVKKDDINNEIILSENNESQIEETEDLYTEETQKKLNDAMSKITYKVNEEIVDGDTAKVNVTVNSMDLGIVFGKILQESMSYVFAQAFSGQELTEEQQDAYMDELLNKNLDTITYSEKTGDINLVKLDNNWKIKEDSNLTSLIMGMDFSSMEETEVTEEEPVAIQEMVLNQPLLVETEHGNYSLTIEGARVTGERNEFSDKEVQQVVFLDYSYENISFGETSGDDLYIDEYAFQVLDDEGNVLDTYPVYDENRTPKDTPVGGKCKASGSFGIATESKSLNVTFKRGNQKVAKILVPIN